MKRYPPDHPAMWSRCQVCQRLAHWGACDSDGTASAALCEDIAVPQDCQARAESIAQKVQP